MSGRTFNPECKCTRAELVLDHEYTFTQACEAAGTGLRGSFNSTSGS